VFALAADAGIRAGLKRFDRVNVGSDNERLHDVARFAVFTGVVYLIDDYDNRRAVDL
jgi:hypothetical protein